MNILYLNNSMHLGGDNKCLLKLCKEFNNKENKVIVASDNGPLVEELNSMNIRWYKINHTDDKGPISILKNIKDIIKIVKSENIDIIHSHHRMATLLAKVVSKFVKVKVVHTQHSCIVDKLKLTNIALKNISVITVSNGAKEILKNKSHLDESNITTIYNTIELESKSKIIDKKLRELKNEGNFIIGQIGRVVEYKGIYDFVDIAKKVTEFNNKIKFVLIGDGCEKEKLQEYIKLQGLENQVYLLGSKDNVIEHLKYLDLVLLCSYIEGLPLAPIEAFSQKIPAIATNISGTNEEIVNGVNGFLVEPKDIDDFTNKIIEVFSNKELYRNLKYNAYESFKINFNNEVYVKSHKKLYTSLINNN